MALNAQGGGVSRTHSRMVNVWVAMLMMGLAVGPVSGSHVVEISNKPANDVEDIAAGEQLPGTPYKQVRQATQRSLAGCSDQYSGCAAWKQSGYCAPAWASDGKSVKDYWCPKTCGTCAASCADQTNSCASWKSGGYCGAQYVYQSLSVLTYWCPLTCGGCGSGSKAPPSPPPPSPPKNGPGCNNGNSAAQPFTSVSASMEQPISMEVLQAQPSIHPHVALPLVKSNTTSTRSPTRSPKHKPKHKPPPARRPCSGRKLLGVDPLTNHGGPVMSGLTVVHLIWYGNWASNIKTKPLIEDLVAHLGCTPWWQNVANYCANDGSCVGGLALGSSVIVQGSSLSISGDDDSGSNAVFQVAGNAINSGVLGQTDSKHNLFLVIPSTGVTMPPGFGRDFCGWHTARWNGTTTWKYGLIGNPSATPNCGGVNPPANGDFTADTMASVVAHEIAEAVSDPEISTWMDSQGMENADKCAWNWLTTRSLSNGAKWNLQVGSRFWLIQSNWKLSTNACTMGA